MKKLRWPVRLFVGGTIALGLAATVIAAVAAAPGPRGDAWLVVTLFAMATVAQLRPIHVSAKRKLTVEDTATFAAVLLFDPFFAMVLAGASSLLAAGFLRRMSLHNRLFNAATIVISVGAGASVLALLGGALAPAAILASASAMYLVRTALVDVVVGLQLRRSPISGWWAGHRSDLASGVALYGLGALAATTVAITPWAMAAFAIPMAVVFRVLRGPTKPSAQPAPRRAAA